ncbi:hypothetical protein [Brevibacillus halotolerans]|uniref:hypothetical protein n=1 Tax=Brevibacillus halotolerans TaxID=1507437 RepID=UPI001FEC700C|nr:hypothetical protein [Brevibacillus halotolerans]
MWEIKENWKRFNEGRRFSRHKKYFWIGYHFERKADNIRQCIIFEILFLLFLAIYYTWNYTAYNIMIILASCMLVYYGIKFYRSCYHIIFCVSLSVIMAILWTVFGYTRLFKDYGLLTSVIFGLIGLYFHLIGLIRHDLYTNEGVKNKKERKERINEVIDLIEDAIQDLQEDIERYETVVKKLEQLEANERKEVESNFLQSLVENCGIEDARDLLEDFKIDLEDYMSKLSNSKRKSLEEKYSVLDDIIEALDVYEDDRIQEYIDRLEYCIQELEYTTN